MKKKSKRGGVRAGAGRKPIEDKKKGLTIFVRQSVINHHGGIERTKRLAEELLNKAIEI